VGLAGCYARAEPTAKLPRDLPVEYPDADVAEDTGVPTPTYWRDVYPIVFSRCTYCHANEERDRLSGAPPIVTFAQTQAASPIFPGQQIYERMAFRVLNDNGTAGSMPQLGSPMASMMTLEERRIITRWAAAGAPEGELPDGGVIYPDASPADGSGPPLPWANGPATSDAGQPGVRYIDVYANRGDMRTPHQPLGRRTNYNCFVFTVPPHPQGAAGEYAISFLPLLQLRRNIHHMEIYRQNPADPHDPSFPADMGPAGWRTNTWWDCEGRTSQEQLIANYVPGQPVPIVLPRDVGYQIHPGDRLMLEIHYDGAPGSTDDMSGFRLTTTATQPAIRNAGEFWVGPFFTQDIAPTVGNNVNSRVVIESECTITQPVTVFWVRPHMHERGRRQQFWIRRAGSPTRTTLADVNPWDVGNQPLIDVPPAEQQFAVGDIVGTSCEYQTMGRDLRWGAGGNDEMCFFNMIHYPFTFTQSACWERNCADPQRCPVTYP